jgi:hypothetical protein
MLFKCKKIVTIYNCHQTHVLVLYAWQRRTKKKQMSAHVEDDKCEDGRQVDRPPQRRNDVPKQVEIRIGHRGQRHHDGLGRVGEPREDEAANEGSVVERKELTDAGDQHCLGDAIAGDDCGEGSGAEEVDRRAGVKGAKGQLEAAVGPVRKRGAGGGVGVRDRASMLARRRPLLVALNHLSRSSSRHPKWSTVELAIAEKTKTSAIATGLAKGDDQRIATQKAQMLIMIYDLAMCGKLTTLSTASPSYIARSKKKERRVPSILEVS